ncbi:MAG: hypothetical protein V3R73_00390, partial [Sphingomonadales bacterium]
RRDAAVAKWKKEHRGEDVFEDREFMLPSLIHISVDDQIQVLSKELDSRAKRGAVKRAKTAVA